MCIRPILEHDIANRLTDCWPGTVQVLSSLVSCINSGCEVAAGDGPETAQWHTVAVTSVCSCSVSKRQLAVWVHGMVTGLMYLAFSYTVFSSNIREVPGSYLGQTPTLLKVSLFSLTPFMWTLAEENLHYTTTVSSGNFPGHGYSVILPFNCSQLIGNVDMGRKVTELRDVSTESEVPVTLYRQWPYEHHILCWCLVK